MNQFKKVAFYTLGCKLNFSETSTISRLFEDAGIAKVNFEERPDIYVINTCSVTENADKKCRQLVKKAKKINPNSFVIIVGCFAQLKPVEIGAMPGVDMVLGANEKFNLPALLNNLEENEDKKINSICKFEFIEKVKSKNIRQDNPDQKLELLTMDYLKNKDNYEINLIFANNAFIALSSEIIDVCLEDQEKID